MAAYIDLNPVRAGLVSDPKDYRYSDYGEAMGGGQEARQGLRQLMNVIVYTDHYYATFHSLEYTAMVLDVPATSRQKLRELIKHMLSQMRLSFATGASP